MLHHPQKWRNVLIRMLSMWLSPTKGFALNGCSSSRTMDRRSAWRLHFQAFRPSISWKPVAFDTLPIVHGMRWASWQHCIRSVQFTHAARSLVSHLILRLVFKGRSLQTGSSTALSPPRNGGMISSSPEATCSSSGRRNKFEHGVRHITSRCGRW